MLPVATSADGKSLVLALVDDTARAFDPTAADAAKAGRQVLAGRAGPVTAVAVRPDHATIATVAYGPKGDLLATGGDDKLVKFWNPADGKELRKGEGHGAAVYCVAFRPPDGTILASASVDKTIRLWNVADAKEVQKLDGHPDDVYALAFSPDGKQLAVAAADDQRCLFNLL